MTEEMAYKNSSPPSWLNAEFVQTALRNGENDSTITVAKCDVNSDASFCSFGTDIYSVTATLQNDEQRSLIVKCRAQAGLGSQLVELFDKEINLVTKTIPEMEKLLKDACPDDFQPFGPKCFHHGTEPLPFIVLEDLKKTGFTYARRRMGLDIGQCYVVLRTLARFHASSIALNQKNPDELEYCSKHDFAERFRGPVEKFISSGVVCLANEVKNWPGYETFEEKLLGLKDSMCDRFGKAVQRKDDSLNSLIHADTCGTNILFKISENAITDIRMADFQSVVYASPVIDVLNCLYGSGDFRVQFMAVDSLIKEYHSTLSKTLNLLGHSDLSPSFEDFQQLVSERKFYAFYLSTTVLPLLVYDPNESLEAGSSENSEEVLGLNPIVYKGSVYKSMIQCLLIQHEDEGLLN